MMSKLYNNRNKISKPFHFGIINSISQITSCMWIISIINIVKYKFETSKFTQKSGILQPPPIVTLITQPSSFTTIHILFTLLESMICGLIKIINNKFILDLDFNWPNIKNWYLNTDFLESRVDQTWDISRWLPRK